MNAYSVRITGDEVRQEQLNNSYKQCSHDRDIYFDLKNISEYDISTIYGFNGNRLRGMS